MRQSEIRRRLAGECGIFLLLLLLLLLLLFLFSFFLFLFLFSRDEATLYEGVSVRRMDGWSDGPMVRWSVGLMVRNQFFFRPTRSDLCRVY